MSRFWTTFTRSARWAWLVAVLLAGCAAAAGGTGPTALPTPAALTAPPSPLRTAAPTQTATATRAAPALVIVQPPEAAPEAQAWAPTARAWAEQQGLRVVVVPNLEDAADLGPVVGLIALPPMAEEQARAWAGAHPQVRVLAWRVAPPQAEAPPPPANLTIVAAEPLTWEQRFFLAGYTAVLAAENWRAGLLYTSPPGYAAAEVAQAFARGAAYWCGPCVPAYPPMVRYPVAREVPPGVEDPDAWQAAAEALLAEAPLEAVYVRGPQAAAQAVAWLRAQEVTVIWDGPPGVEADVRVFPEPWMQLDAAWLTAWLQGQAPAQVVAGWQVEPASAAAFSPGRARLVQELFAALLAGRVDAAAP